MAKAQQPFWLGGASASMAACFSVKSLWSGLSASILRQTTYSTARFALYNTLAQRVKQASGGKLSSMSTIACAGVAGGAAGMLGNPTEVVLVRMCADGVKPVGEKYRYPNALVGMVRIGQEEGLRAFYKGLGPNIIRSVLMSELNFWIRENALTCWRCFSNRRVFNFENSTAVKQNHTAERWYPNAYHCLIDGWDGRHNSVRARGRLEKQIAERKWDIKGNYEDLHRINQDRRARVSDEGLDASLAETCVSASKDLLLC
ncbi:2-oxoglutarate malate carrier [Hyphodiscus hymeniophilus]|uniref:2-oxoglutarate malate carrier n=1 Tax=Hyphodiscus hymeniophilus TaxID=353542 RepID=A0A9P6VEN2_9HELO|nr:2-oxoglutarate malate carrier [Hyphodiscus hymeniophilus]